MTFESVGTPEDALAESPEDKITKISKPFLEGPVVDAIGDSDLDAAAASFTEEPNDKVWSQTVNGLQARITMKEEKVFNETQIISA